MRATSTTIVILTATLAGMVTFAVGKAWAEDPLDKQIIIGNDGSSHAVLCLEPGTMYIGGK